MDGILGFNLTKEKEFHSEIMLQNTKTHRIYSDKLVFHMIELKKIKDVAEEDKDSLYYWASLIAAESQEEYDMLAKHNEYKELAVFAFQMFVPVCTGEGNNYEINIFRCDT